MNNKYIDNKLKTFRKQFVTKSPENKAIPTVWLAGKQEVNSLEQFIKEALELLFQEPEEGFSDLKPFVHGSEGTHYACAEALQMGEGCCGCNRHKCKEQL